MQLCKENKLSESAIFCYTIQILSGEYKQSGEGCSKNVVLVDRENGGESRNRTCTGETPMDFKL